MGDRRPIRFRSPAAGGPEEEQKGGEQGKFHAFHDACPFCFYLSLYKTGFRAENFRFFEKYKTFFYYSTKKPEAECPRRCLKLISG